MRRSRSIRAGILRRGLLAAVAVIASVAIPLAGLATVRHAHAASETLSPGWNTVIYDGPALPPDAAFASLGEALRGAYVLVSVDGVPTWQYYIPMLPASVNTLALAAPGMVYWLNLTAQAVYEAPSPPPAPSPAPTPILAPDSEGWRVVEQGMATWYGPELAGNRTACGDIFDPALLTAASNTLPCGTIASVTNTANGKSVVVRINDTGGFRPPLMIDLSQAAYETISAPNSGSIPVVIRVR